MSGLRKRGRSRLLIAVCQRERDVAWAFVPHRRRARLDRVLDIGDGRQRLVVDHKKLGRIARLFQRFGHHHGNAIADAAHPVADQDRAAGTQSFRAADVLRHEVGRQATEAIGLHVVTGQHTHDPGRGARRRCVDAFDARMRMRREHDDCMRLVRQLDVIDEAAASGEKAHVLDAAYRLADAIGFRVELLVHGRSLIARAQDRTAHVGQHVRIVLLIKWPLRLR